MVTVLSPDLEVDAEELETHWGIRVALEMLREHVITVLDFFELCEEVATAPEHHIGAAAGAQARQFER